MHHHAGLAHVPHAACDPHTIAQLELGWEAPRPDETVRVRCRLGIDALAPRPVRLTVLTAQAAMSSPVACDGKAAVCSWTLEQPLLTERAVRARRAHTLAAAKACCYSGLREVAVAALHVEAVGVARGAAVLARVCMPRV